MMFLFGKKEDPKLNKELFTYFTPTPPLRNRGYREKELDLVAQLFNQYQIHFEIQSTISSHNGFWTIFYIWGSQKNLHAMKSSEQFADFQLASQISKQELNNEEDQLELISENDEQFENMDNFKI